MVGSTNAVLDLRQPPIIPRSFGAGGSERFYVLHSSIDNRAARKCNYFRHPTWCKDSLRARLRIPVLVNPDVTRRRTITGQGI